MPSLAIGVEMTRAVMVRPDATLEVVVARNAVKELAWGFVPILACPARGHERGETSAAVAMCWGENDAPWSQGRRARSLVEDPVRRRFTDAVGQVLTVGSGPHDADASPVEVLAVKPASRGEGIVVRLIDRSGCGTVRAVLRTVMPLERAVMCDVRERDLGRLEVHPRGSGAEVSIVEPGSVISVRLLPALPDDRG